MTDQQDQVRECADRCASCGAHARLVTVRPAALIECSNPRCHNAVSGLNVEQCVIAWNVRQRRAKHV